MSEYADLRSDLLASLTTTLSSQLTATLSSQLSSLRSSLSNELQLAASRHIDTRLNAIPATITPDEITRLDARIDTIEETLTSLSSSIDLTNAALAALHTRLDDYIYTDKYNATRALILRILREDTDLRSELLE